MITNTNKKIVRDMLKKSLFLASAGSATSLGGLFIVNAFLSGLWQSREINLKQFNRYIKLFENACDDSSNLSIISFKGL